MTPVLGATALWTTVVTGFGAATMLLGAYRSVQETDLKRILAYSTVSALGLLTMLIGVGTDRAIAAALVYFVAHACYKGALFLVAGAIDHQTGSRDIRTLSGLHRTMPLTAIAGGRVEGRRLPAPPPQQRGDRFRAGLRAEPGESRVVGPRQQRGDREGGVRRLGVGRFEAHAPPGQRIDAGGGWPGIPVGAQVIRPEGVDGDEHQIGAGVSGTASGGRGRQRRWRRAPKAVSPAWGWKGSSAASRGPVTWVRSRARKRAFWLRPSADQASASPRTTPMPLAKGPTQRHWNL